MAQGEMMADHLRWNRSRVTFADLKVAVLRRWNKWEKDEDVLHYTPESSRPTQHLASPAATLHASGGGDGGGGRDPGAPSAERDPLLGWYFIYALGSSDCAHGAQRQVEDPDLCMYTDK